MKKLGFLILASLGLLGASISPSAAWWCYHRPIVHHWWPVHHCCGYWHWHWYHETVEFRDHGPGYVWWDVPYYYYSPYRIVHHVLVHESEEIGPQPVWP